MTWRGGLRTSNGCRHVVERYEVFVEQEMGERNGRGQRFKDEGCLVLIPGFFFGRRRRVITASRKIVSMARFMFIVKLNTPRSPMVLVRWYRLRHDLPLWFRPFDLGQSLVRQVRD